MSPISVKSRLLFIALSKVAVLLCAIASGEDLVTYSRVDGSTARVTGLVVEYTGERLTLRRASGREESLDGGRVLRVETQWSDECLKGDKQFETGDYAAARQSYQRAFESEDRRWAKRRIVGRLVWCFQYLGQVPEAVGAFLWLYRSDPSTQFFPAIPLAWVADPARSGLYQKEAAVWLADDSQVARLIGASRLLSTARRGDAIRALQELDSADGRIVFLAQAQLWRTRIGTATADQISSWEQRLNLMPLAIRAGPYYTLGQALSQQARPARAALAFLRVPIHFPEHRQLAAYALVAAGRELEKDGQTAAAVPLYREVITDYSESPIADEAGRQLARLHSNE